MNQTFGLILLTVLACTVIPKAEAQYYNLYYPYYSYYPYSYYYYYPSYYVLGKRSTDGVEHKQVMNEQVKRMTRGTYQRSN
ncbi:uncharacterized protein CELE_F41E6.15 [Caenorhabditis elegans]|uniref:Uncharacterized protein n=1 Tax=Caenorhabditis elegans TaxID=6239 RepID=Q4R144_CAEEL|nr:Uncharacterized protein CELE_F41E6.15 [Caenorhabditis elegans]CCD64098.1 Uncharacterized protein CELE_F41E6.15 [Caenorhabditis elegans]|eukprot:NP_001033485.2 Uncharacterized protein CELE_F41E6.15 [Caenorhabditis elegans]